MEDFPEPKNGVREMEPSIEPGSEIFYNRPVLYGNEKAVEIRYTSEDGFVYLKSVNVPYTSDGKIDESSFDRIVEEQSRSLRTKLDLGTILPQQDAGNPEYR
jgi:hypothetical protein